jgi:diguanylate cyclase (GGDEF)-like protein/PAS domain S-box-containing protein
MTFVLHAHEPFIAAIVQSVEDRAVFTVDHAGYVTRWNPAAERITGFPAGEVVGRHVGALVGGEDPADEYEGVLQLAARMGRLELDREWVRRDGSTFRAEGRITAIRGERGDLLGFVTVLREASGTDGDGAASGPRSVPYDSLFQLHPDPVAALDADARFVHANPAWEALCAHPAEELPGASLLALVVPEDRRRVQDAVRHASRGETQRLPAALLREGERVELDLTCIPRTLGGEVAGAWAVARDVAAERAAGEELRGREAFFRGMVEDADEVFFFALDGESRFRYLSPSVYRVLGYRPRELLGLPLAALMDTGAESGPATNGTGPGARTAAVRHGDGRRVLLELVEHPSTGGEAGAVHGFARDVTGAREREEQLLRGALHDPLTGLANRPVFLDRLGHAARRGERRPEERVAVLLVDLDRFGLVNDGMGRELGDALLVEVGRRLRRSVRPGDTLCRLRGDEFGLLLEGLPGAEGALRVAERIQRSLASPFRLRSHELLIGASVGIAVSTAGAAEPEELLRDAATALGEVRARGGGGIEVAGSEVQAGARSRGELEAELRRAVERNELALVYQPVVSLRTGEISGFEALVRWRHPERGTIRPAEFLPLAEETGAILAVDRWVLREACRQLRSWQEEFPDRECRISVNLSGRQLASPDTAERIRGVLEECELSGASLQVEVGEGALSEGMELSTAVLRRIQALGVQIGIDHFGSGSASLTRLHRIPARTLKIDPSRLEGDEVVRAAVSMAHSLDRVVVAEGIETSEQLDRLRAMDFDYGQGYLFSEPVDGELAGLLLSRRLPL